ncbi:popeye domain-containing 2-like isoform X2 [Petromyzon marinus]|uniref:popeye domain-containing 2-like isoform X2 n=1 Tax=Petromyzon marinus TaxID=7757 RepID=UPI003F6ECC9E
MSTPCLSWRTASEGAVFHAACLLLSISLSAGSTDPGPYWRIYISITSLLAFTGWALWAWLGLCSVDALCWSLILAMACVSRATLDVWRLRETRFPGPPEVRSWYDATFRPLHVPRANFLRLVQQALKPEADGSPASESRVGGHGGGHGGGQVRGHGGGHGGGQVRGQVRGHGGGHGLLRLEAGEFYARQGETPIDRLGVLLDGRMTVNMDSVTLP